MELTACLGTINWSDSMHVHYSIQVIYLWYQNISISPQAQLNRYQEIKYTCRLERSLNSLRSASYIMFSRYFLFFNIVFISYMCLGLYQFHAPRLQSKLTRNKILKDVHIEVWQFSEKFICQVCFEFSSKFMYISRNYFYFLWEGTTLNSMMNNTV